MAISINSSSSSSVRASSSSAKFNSAPSRTFSTPVRTAAASAKSVSTAARSAPTAAKIASSPVRTAAAPVRNISTLVRTVAGPTRPAEMSAKPQNKSSSSQLVSGAGGVSAIIGGRVASGGLHTVATNPKTSVVYYTSGGARGKAPYSGPMQVDLTKLGIKARPLQRDFKRVTGKGANGLNGNLFRDQAVAKAQTSVYNPTVRKEVVINQKTNTLTPARTARAAGTRVADGVVKSGHWNPFSSEQIFVEAKDAHVTSSKTIPTKPTTNLGQAKDYAKVASAINARRAVGVTNFKVGGALGVVGVGLTAAQLTAAYHADGKTFGQNTQRASAQAAGGWAGAWAGAKLGAAAGGVGGLAAAGIGAVPGAIGGAIVGAVAGGISGSYIGDSVYSYFSSN